MAAVPSPAAPTRAPSPWRPPSQQERPDLRVVTRPRHSARFAAVLVVVAAMAIFGVVALHAMAAEAAFEARVLEGEVAELSVRQEELAADVARLESPDRIRDVAVTELGMVPAEQPVYMARDGSSLPTDHAGPHLAGALEQRVAGE